MSADITCSCPHRQQHLEVPKEMAGTSGKMRTNGVSGLSVMSIWRDKMNTIIMEIFLCVVGIANAQTNAQTNTRASHIGHPSNWKPFNGHHYLAVQKKLSWDDACKATKDAGGHLAIIKSQEQNDFIFKTFCEPLQHHRPGHDLPDHASLWIGCTDILGPAKKNDKPPYAWVNGDPIVFSAWADGEPYGRGGEHYGTMFVQDGQWNDLPIRSDIVIGYVCEWDY